MRPILDLEPVDAPELGDVVGHEHEASGEAVKAPEFLSRAAAAYAPVRYMTPEQFGELLKGLDAYYQKVWKETPWNEN